jgi:YHS domain-containing protein
LLEDRPPHKKATEKTQKVLFGEANFSNENSSLSADCFNERGREVTYMAIDPVCKMNVDEKNAAATYEYKGKTYYFCAVGCKEAFAKDPEKHLTPKDK